MTNKNIIVGLDVGSANVRTVIAQDMGSDEVMRIIGVGETPSAGMRKGLIIDVEEIVKSINSSIEMAEKMTGVNVEKVIVGIGGSGIEIQNSKGVVAVGKADGEVIMDDIERVLDAAQTISIPPNKEIIHIIPKKYRLDDQDNIKDPLDMKGVRLEVDALVIEGPGSQVKNLNKCAYQLGFEVENFALNSLVAANSVLNKKQKELGVALIDIGGSTTSVTVFEEGNLIHTSILPIGAGHITNDIAIGLRIPIELAEKIKLEYGSAFPDLIEENEEIDLSQIDSKEDGAVSRYHVAEIIEARLSEIFDMVNKELESIGKSGLLPAGAVLIGGGAKMPQIVDFAKERLGLPAQIGFPNQFGGLLDKVDDPSFSVVSGLILWKKESEFNLGSAQGDNILTNLSSNFEDVTGKAKEWIGKFLP